MMEFKVTGLGLDTRTDHPLVILHNKDENLLLPIWIGRFEAQSIALTLSGEVLERPLTHDLFINVLNKTHYQIQRSEICNVRDGIFYCALILKNLLTDELENIDARPSDCISICLKLQAPIMVSDSVKELACIPAIIESSDDSDDEFSLDNANSDIQNYKLEKQEFLKFLDNVKASDFNLK